MSVMCHNPVGDRHEIPDGDRKITLTAIVVWGANDLRDDWTGDYTFCSFACLADWATERASDHDGHELHEGASDSSTSNDVAEQEEPTGDAGPATP